MNKPFVLFGFENHEQAGGWHDQAGNYETLEDAKRAHMRRSKKDCRWNYHVVNLRIRKIVAIGYTPP